ncbi:efflux RND transporter permease subunit [Thermoflavimicrobium dichotomicum]|uniref:Hydrophobic/amphiphilic exporter-1, HAE1 family n=1 Tax=Thermoflavimicrobium dichotomicum TaxID=46223 RepID=A0A1I3K4T9_9BACL|nr:efflux RND transporter permease subunit [Thermoflavimicrobium dichotomicum]SFI67503.1 hydrophobic/amphiphilic exporter-1, HAE1 family [Thermoflavimicrobium dichotomicum]
MFRLTQWSLKNGIALFILCLLVLGGGLFTATQISKEIMPDTSYPALWIQISVPGQSAEENEKTITRPLEEKIMAANEAQKVVSTTSSHMVSVQVEYPYGTDLDKVNSKLEAIVNSLKIPEHAERQILSNDNAMNTIYYFALTSKNPDQLQQKLNNTIIPELKKINGIANVDVQGEKKAKWLIEVNQDKAKAKGISLQTIKETLNAKNTDMTVGAVESDGKTIPVDIKGDLRSINDLKELTITSNAATGAGQPGQPSAVSPKVKLSDIATIKQTSEDTEISRFNQEPAFVISVTKEKSGNTVELTKAVQKVIDKYKSEANYQVYPIFSFGNEIETSISKLVKEGLFGALFTVVVIALFLRSFRATIISIISLPVSILLTITVLDQVGYTLNVMTLGGLAVAVGRIVDDSIVVIENIYRWLQERGNQFSRKEIAFQATKEVMSAVASSTFVTCVVFLPLALIEGYAGELFRPFALAVAFSILTSLLVAIMLIPVLGKAFLTKVKHKETEGKLASGYEKLLRLALKRRGWVIALAILLLIGSVSLVPMLGFSLMPSGSSSALMVGMVLPATTELKKTDEVAKKVENYLKNKKEIEYSSAEVGQSVDMMSMQKKENEARFMVRLKKGYTADQMMSSMKREITNLVKAEVPQAEVSVDEYSMGAENQGNNINIELYGDDLLALEKASKQVEDLLKQNDQLKNVKNEMNEVRTKWSISLNQKGKDLNLDPNQLMGFMNDQLQPVEIVDYKLNQDKINLTIAYDKKMTSKEKLLDLKIPTSSGEKPLKEVANLVEEKTPIDIKREDGHTLANVTAQVKGNDVYAVSQKVQKDVAALKLPEGVSLKTTGGSEEINKEFAKMGIAMLTAIGLVFLLLSITFQGLLTPLVILTSILFVPIGSFGSLLLAKQPLSLSALIGILMLIGIVVTNAVVLLDRVENNRRKGMDVDEAIVEAGKVRLRPILMTAVATVFALIPLALSSDTESLSAILISKGLAITVIGGLTTSTLLTLVIVPSFYRAVDRFRRNKERFEEEIDQIGSEKTA